MYLSALILGFTGSIHCIGMCSPLAMAVTNMSRTVWLNRFLYNAGRISTYALMGMVAASANALIPVAQYQNMISIMLGVVLLVMAFIGFSSVSVPIVTPLLAAFVSQLKQMFSHYLQKRTKGAIAALGMINGFLPCGLTFISLAFCLTLKSSLQGFGYMLLFGLGTLPAMLGFAVLIKPMVMAFQWRLKHVMTVLLFVSGCLLIARGVTDHHTRLHSDAADAPMASEIIICR